MSLKRMFALLAVLTLVLCALPLGAMAAQTPEEVGAMVEALPDLEALKAMSAEEQQAVYTQTQTAYDAYQALSDEEKATLEGAEATFEALFGYFNTLVMPLEGTEPAEEPETQKKEGLPWGITALILAAVTTFLQNKFIHGRR